MKNTLYELSAEKLASIEKIYVFGDLHGDYFPFSQYLKTLELKSQLIIFLGDYADRGQYGIETIYTINRLLTQYPENVLALKGNHEDYQADGTPVFNPCDLQNEVRTKKGSWLKYFETTFVPFLEKLYLGILIPGELLFVHGGISSKIDSLEDLRSPSAQIEKDILWSDPIEESKKYPNKAEFDSVRGLGVLFTRKVTEKILTLCNVKKIIRSHQPRIAKEKVHFSHNGQVLTINSTSVYEGKPHVLVINPAQDFTLTSEFI